MTPFLDGPKGYVRARVAAFRRAAGASMLDVTPLLPVGNPLGHLVDSPAENPR
ncbi:hypothetical protein [Streptomyces sp. V3I7]|uniref:hypothetical protein n=1 Tax=Streptomyces sp. V3I7 TaxID=3042278 RepID=UPI00278174E9|nr:hypothetical protein [Streptomyces sp. V3I7]MDQ0994122.1 hypothetical protein [Streptomyces sp. V3I7]